MHNNNDNNELTDPNKEFLKELISDFYYKIINYDSFGKFETFMNKWVKNSIIYNDKNSKEILHYMRNLQKNEFWVTSLIGYFHQNGIGCDVDKNKALESYMLVVNQGSSETQSLEENHINDTNDFQR